MHSLTKKNTVTILKALFWLASAVLAFSACSKQTVGYVDTSRVVKDAARFQSARDSLVHFNEQWKSEAKGLDSLVKDLAEQITAQTKKDSKLDSLMNRYTSKQHDLQRFVQASSEKARKLEEDLMGPHLKSTNSCLQKFLADQKLTLLLGTQQAGTILAGAPSADYTDRVVVYLNTQCKE